MKPTIVGGACHRVQQALDDALAEGVLRLPPELGAHAARCQRCQPEVQEVEALFARLRSAGAGIDLGQVPAIVDRVMVRAAAPVSAQAPAAAGGTARRKVSARWVLGQIAAVAAVLVLGVGLLTYGVLKVNQAVSGASPSDVVARLLSPFQRGVQAELKE